MAISVDTWDAMDADTQDLILGQLEIEEPEF